MQTASWRTRVILGVLAFGTVGALVNAALEIGAPARPAARSRVATDRRLARTAAMALAPVVTDAVGPGQPKTGLPSPPMSIAMQLADQFKQVAALTYLRHKHLPRTKSIAGTQQAQLSASFSGPATASEMLAQMRAALPQLAAAVELGTTLAGTDWSNRHGYPLPRVLNAHQRLNHFVSVGLPASPSAAQLKTYEIDLMTDINHQPGVPIAGNADEVPGGPHLVGHPPGLAIMQWFDIRGYSRSGAITEYEDSVHGASSVSWSAGVPAYSVMDSVAIVAILGARGYVW